MSAAATFFLNTASPKDLFDSLVRVWSDRRAGRDVILFDRTRAQAGFNTESPISDDEMKRIKEAFQRLEQQVAEAE